MMEGNRKNIYVYVGLGHFAVQQKLLEHCKSTLIIFFNLMKKTHDAILNYGGIEQDPVGVLYLSW